MDDGAQRELEIVRHVLAEQPLGVLVLSLPDLRFHFVNKAAARFVPSGTELIGRTLHDALPMMAEQIAPLLERLAQTGKAQDLVDVAMPSSPTSIADDRIAYVSAHLKRFDANGHSYICACFVDSTREVHARSLLRAEMARTEALLEREKEASRLATMLTDCDQLVHSTLDFGSIAKGLVEIGCEALSADVGSVSELLDGQWRVHVEHGFGDDHLRVRIPESDLPPAMFAHQKEPLVMDDTGDLPGAAGRLMHEYGIASCVIVPLYARDVVSGVLFFGRTSARPFSDSQRDFARRIGVSASLAIHNAGAYASERHLADTLQEALLALPEGLSGIRYARAYHSAAEEANVGGDFYDLIHLGDDRIAITTGDISGKGLDAAVLTSLVKNTLRGHAMDEESTPATAMKAANDVLFHATAPHVFATVFFAILDGTNGKLVYCNAGHTPGLLRRTDGTVMSLRSNCPLVGAFVETAFKESAIFMHRNDVLFLYTDGLLEARRGDELLGDERVRQVLEGEDAGEPEAAVRLVLDRALEFTGGTLSDDLALLAVQWTPGEHDIPEQQQLDL